jgi:hypothetical protein
MVAAADKSRTGSEDYGVYDDAKTYYASDERHHNRFGSRTRTYSQVCPKALTPSFIGSRVSNSLNRTVF